MTKPRKLTPKQGATQLYHVYGKCVGCGAKREVSPDELSSADVPMCKLCFMPMVAERVEGRLK